MSDPATEVGDALDAAPLPYVWLKFTCATKDGYGVMIPDAPAEWPDDLEPMGGKQMSRREQLAFEYGAQTTVSNREKMPEAAGKAAVPVVAPSAPAMDRQSVADRQLGEQIAATYRRARGE